MTPLRRSQLNLLINLIVLLGVVSGVTLLQYPQLHALREQIDTTRASIAAITIQQQNLEDLQNQQATLASAASQLQKEVWTFQNEDAFYKAIQTIAEKTGTTIPEPKLSDAVPGTNYQIRTGTIDISGASAKIIQALDHITQLQPLVAIQQTVFTGGSATPSVSLTIQTTWQ
jgi:FtsZ-binding cell division protein ZapB